jgi:hypothetical protein
VRAVDHERDDVARRELDAQVQRVDRCRGRVGAEVDVPELRTEAADVLLAQHLFRRRTILDHDDLVVEVVGQLLVRAGERVE